MKVIAKLNNLRVSPRKVRDTADMIRGCRVEEALYRLNSTVRRSNDSIAKLVNSAIANAKNNFGLKEDNLYISEITVNEGPTLKRWMPRAQGRATQILKRTSKIQVVLGELEITTEAKKKEVKKEIKKSEPKKKVAKKVVKTEGVEKIEEKVAPRKEKISKDAKKAHKEVESERKASRELGFDKKMYKKTSDKKKPIKK